MKLKRHLNFPIVEISIALMIIVLPLSNNPDLMNGIQTAKSFNFFYSILFLVTIGSIVWMFKKDKPESIITSIDILLLAYVSWVTINKFLVHEVHCFSLKYYELLGLSVLYIILRLIDKKYYLLLLVSICISGTIQAIYGCLQLWGYYPSNHGLFKITGSFFNPGPYAGFLAGILPIALGLYWSVSKEEEKNAINDFKLQVSGFRFPINNFKFQVTSFRLRSYLRNQQLGIWNLKLVITKYIALTTIITILLVLPAARSRAAWLGAMAGCIYLAWHKYKATTWIKNIINGSIKSPLGDLGVNLAAKTKRILLFALISLILVAGCLTLYHYKKHPPDGRLLSWTVTSNIIKDYPLLGVGQDLFKAHYMNYQADYFRNHPGSKYEMVADDKKYAFNELLNTWTENGIIGFLLFFGILGFVFLSKTKTIENTKSELHSAVSFWQGTQRNPFKFNGIPPTVGMTNHSNSEASNHSNVSEANFKHEVSNPSNLSAANLEHETSNSTASNPSNVSAANLEHEVSNISKVSAMNIKPIEPIEPSPLLRSSLLAFIVFGLFAYPGEILPIKTATVVCVALLAGMVLPIYIRRVKPFVLFAKNPLFLKLSFLIITIAALFFVILQVKMYKVAYCKWKDAFDLYQYGLYEECIEDYATANQYFNKNGEFLINYGKALSIAEKHKNAVEVLGIAQSYLTNTVLHTALGDSKKALKEYKIAEENYWQASEMAPGKFYPQYLLAKLYDESGQKQKAVNMATALFNKKIKIESTAIVEIKEEMRKIIYSNSNIKSQLNTINNETMNREKGRNNQTTPQKYWMVTLPQALSKSFSQQRKNNKKGGEVTKI